MNVLLQNGADVHSTGSKDETALHCCARLGSVDIARALIQNDADLNVLNSRGWTALGEASYGGNVPCVLQLICSGAEMKACDHNPDVTFELPPSDMTNLLQPIKSRYISLREGKGMETSLMSDEERRFMWNLAFFFTIAHREVAFKAYYAIRSFITFHGIFMAPGFDLGEDSTWKPQMETEDLKTEDSNI